jgi:hydrogenase expression/formation protein HypC
MCLGDVAEVLRVLPERRALVRAGSRTGTVSLLTLEDAVDVGDWVLCHSGFALHRVTASDAREAAALREPRDHPVAATPAATTTQATTTEEQR